MNAILRAGSESLEDIDWLERVVRSAGLKYLPPPHGALYGADHRWMNFHGDGLFQIPRQIAGLLLAVGPAKPMSALEIGTNNGWTACVMSAYFLRQNPSFRLDTVDIKDHFIVKRWARRRLNVHFHQGKTSEDFARQRYDFCFIDGDHTYEWVSKDYESVGRFASICAFHDINDARTDVLDGGGSRRHWQELRDTLGSERTLELKYHSCGEAVMGIGIAFRGQQ